MAGFVNVDSLVNNTFKSATKKLMSSLDDVVGSANELKPKYIYPKDIDNLATSNYMIIYVYDHNKNNYTFAPINSQIAQSKIQQNLAKKLTDCVSVKLTDNAKKKLKEYKNAISQYLKESLKDIFNKEALGKLGDYFGIDLDTPEWLKDTGDFLKNNQLTRGIKDLFSNIDMPNLPGLDFGDLDLSDWVEVDVDFRKIKGIAEDKLKEVGNKLKGVKSVEDAKMLNAGSDYSLVTSVVLPLPQNEITYEYKINTDAVDTKTAQAIAGVVSSAANAVKEQQKKNSGDSWYSSIVNGAKNVIAGVSGAVEGIANTVAVTGGETLYSLLGSGGKAIYQSQSGNVRDPMLVFTVNIPDPRTFTFEYTMAPRSSSELYDMWNIIKTLKFYSHMEVNTDAGSVRYFRLPGRFIIRYYTEGQENIWLGKTKMLHLIDISTSIDGNNMGFILNDFDKISGNPPKIVKLSLTFKELAVLDRNDINEGY